MQLRGLCVNNLHGAYLKE